MPSLIGSPEFERHAYGLCQREISSNPKKENQAGGNELYQERHNTNFSTLCPPATPPPSNAHDARLIPPASLPLTPYHGELSGDLNKGADRIMLKPADSSLASLRTSKNQPAGLTMIPSAPSFRSLWMARLDRRTPDIPARITLCGFVGLHVVALNRAWRYNTFSARNNEVSAGSLGQRRIGAEYLNKNWQKMAK
jgi:hypothetical protein